MVEDDKGVEVMVGKRGLVVGERLLRAMVAQFFALSSLCAWPNPASDQDTATFAP